ncbi:MAG: hypothetical protein WCC14_06430 [Acidobacteriaceae bacterium]
MNYSTFEQAAVEASTGLREIDAEIERLNTKKALLEPLVRQLSAILPLMTEAGQADEVNNAGTAAVAPVAEQSFSTDGLPEGNSDSLRKAGWPTHTTAGTTADAPAVEQPSLAGALPEGKSFSLRTEGWPSGSTNGNRGIREIL